MVRVNAPAKLNLHLEVLAREDSGYHQLETLFCELELADELELEPAAAGIELAVEAPSPDAEAQLGPAAENLVYRAAELYLAETGLGDGVRIRLRKRIPIGGGLGGGSSDAAATLVGLDRLHRGRLGEQGRLRLGAQLGSDVPFFLCGSPLALAWGRGGRLLPVEALPSLPVLLLLPGRGLSTAAAYEALDRTRTGREANAEPSILRASLLTDWDYIAHHSRNDFEDVVFQAMPELAAARALLVQHGALLARLTGSGSTVFGVFRDHARLQRAAAAAASLGLAALQTRTACPPNPPPFG
jgi:4-diphosphocytidyl-2-C-methyl-D-erythritol kinase